MPNKKVLFVDIEATHNRDFKEIAFVMIDGKKPLKVSQLKSAVSFLKLASFDYLCGHNIIEWDYPLMKEYGLIEADKDIHLIDTLHLSRVFFSEKQVHALPKEYKDDDNFQNDPLKDCELTKILLNNIENRFKELSDDIKDIYIYLMKKSSLFQGFVKYTGSDTGIDSDITCADAIQKALPGKIVSKEALRDAIKDNYEALIYIISQMTNSDIYAHPAGVLFRYPNIIELQKSITYSDEEINRDLNKWAKDIFGFDSFREFARLDPKLTQSPTLSQREIVEVSL